MEGGQSTGLFSFRRTSLTPFPSQSEPEFWCALSSRRRQEVAQSKRRPTREPHWSIVPSFFDELGALHSPPRASPSPFSSKVSSSPPILACPKTSPLLSPAKMRVLAVRACRCEVRGDAVRLGSFGKRIMLLSKFAQNLSLIEVAGFRGWGGGGRESASARRRRRSSGSDIPEIGRRYWRNGEGT